MDNALTFAEIDAAVKGIIDDPDFDAMAQSLMENEQFAEKVVSTAMMASKEHMLSALMHGETDQTALGRIVFEQTVMVVAVTMLIAGRYIERNRAASIADLVALLGEGEDTTEGQ